MPIEYSYQIQSKYFTWTNHLYHWRDKKYSNLHAKTEASKKYYIGDQLAIKIVSLLEGIIRTLLAAITLLPSTLGYTFRITAAVITKDASWRYQETWFMSNVRASIGSLFEVIEKRRIQNVLYKPNYLTATLPLQEIVD